MSTPTNNGRLIHSVIIPAVLFASSIFFISAATAQSGNLCIDTGEPCFLGIDPDIYQMPLFGRYIQSGDERICATTNWSSFPPEAFDIDFMRDFWAFGLDPAQQAETEAASFFFVTTHWGPPGAPAAKSAADNNEISNKNGGSYAIS